MSPKDLTPRNDGQIPKRESVSKLERETMDEIEKMTRDQAHAVAVLAQATAATSENTEDLLLAMSDVKDLLVKVMQHFSIPLPKAIQESIDKKEYDPDNPDLGLEDEEEGSEDEVA